MQTRLGFWPPGGAPQPPPPPPVPPPDVPPAPPPAEPPLELLEAPPLLAVFDPPPLAVELELEAPPEAFWELVWVPPVLLPLVEPGPEVLLPGAVV